MFADACENVGTFTRPVVVSTRYFNGDVGASVASFIVLNREGWILTAAHVLQTLRQAHEHEPALAAYQRRVQEIQQNAQVPSRQRDQRIKQIKNDPKWITNFSYLWGWFNAGIENFQLLEVADLAIGRLEPFDPASVAHYPTIKNPNSVRQGTSLCRIGFPFHSIPVTFDDTSKTFNLSETHFTFFANEGILSRTIDVAEAVNVSYHVGFIETSSPGLKGQSGGPIFDSRGTVWGIQSQTRSYPLDFETYTKQGSRQVKQEQYLHAGWGVHPATLLGFLHAHGIEVAVSDY